MILVIMNNLFYTALGFALGLWFYDFYYCIHKGKGKGLL